MRSAPQRFIETWVDAVLGFLFCVVLPIPLYANDEPFVGPFDASRTAPSSPRQSPTRSSGIAGAGWMRFRGAGLNVAQVAPVAVITYALIAAVLLLLRLDYSRVQLFGSGFLTVLWMAVIAQLRGRYLVRNYAVTPHAVDRHDAESFRPAGGSISTMSASGDARRCHRGRSQLRSSARGSSRRWPMRRSPASRCSIAAIVVEN